jgi:hypothetical protein
MARYRFKSKLFATKEEAETVRNLLETKLIGKAVMGITSVDTSPYGEFAYAEGLVDDAKAEIESLKEEVENWYDSLPEGFQNGEKGDQLQEAMNGLDEIISNCDGVDFGDNPFEEDPSAVQFRVDGSISGKRLRQKTVFTMIQEIVSGFSLVVEETGGSRSARLSEADNDISIARGIIEGLASNINTDVEDVDQKDDLAETKSKLEEIFQGLDGIDCGSVEFPGMYS